MRAGICSKKISDLLIIWLAGAHSIKTPGYVEAVGFIDQTALDLQVGDYGGEEDPVRF